MQTPLDMIKPFKIHEIAELDGGIRRVKYTVKKTEKTAGGVSTSTMDAVIYIDPGHDVDTHLFQELQKQGWF